MDAPSPLLGVVAGSPPTRPEAAPLAVAATAPVVTAAPPWPRSAQWTTVGLLVLALGLLGWHAVGACRWGARPTDPVADPIEHIDLNHADRAQLLQLPGVGDVTAERIEEYRRSHNGFQSVDDLRRVRGVGPALLERLRPLVEVRPYDAPEDDEHPPPPARPAPAVPPVAAAKADKPAARTPKVATKKGDGPAEPIDVNTATADELEQLPHIGPTISARIIQFREQRPFQSVDELRRVKGIGPKTLEALRPFVKVGE